jgi:hypothetical protein
VLREPVGTELREPVGTELREPVGTELRELADVEPKLRARTVPISAASAVIALICASLPRADCFSTLLVPRIEHLFVERLYDVYHVRARKVETRSNTCLIASSACPSLEP